METYDLIIIGAGPGGMNAAVYAGRFKMKTLVIGEMPGGMAAEAVKICNFLTYKEISGAEFTQKMEEQVKELGIEIKYERVVKLEKNEFFEVRTRNDVCLAKKVILAIGSEKRKLDLPKLKELEGKGISYCATCDAAFFRDRIVGVIGGGDSALTVALLLSEYAKKVYLIYRKDKFFRAKPAWVEVVEKNEKIEPVFEAEVVELKGEEKLEGVKLNNGEEIELEGLFIEIGSIPNLLLAEQLGIELEETFIKIDKEQKTNVRGVFAAGDITNNHLKQIMTAAAEGSIAATTAYKEIQEEK